jgi:hypothetical protein
MKLTGKTIGWLIAGFVWSLFMGVTAISIGIGALYPPLNYIAKPLACPNGELSFVQNVSNPIPGTTYTTAGWTCTDSKTGAQTHLDAIKMGVYAGPFYGVLLFLIICFIWYINVVWVPNPVIGKTVWRLESGIGIALLVLFIGWAVVWPVAGVFIDEFAPTPTLPAVDAKATQVEATYQAAISGAPSTPPSGEKPPAEWNNIPIMPEAVSGEQINVNTYVFDISTYSGDIESFYKTSLEAQGWTLEESDSLLGMHFTKDKSALLVTLSPAADEQSFVVTLSYFP